MLNTQDEPSELAGAIRGLGLIHKKRADYESAFKCYQQAISIIRGLCTQTSIHKDLGVYLIDLGDIYRKREQHSTAIDTYLEAHKYIVVTSGPNSPDAADVLYAKSLSHIANGNQNVALETLKETMRINLQLYGPDHYKMGLVESALGVVHSLNSNYEQAREHHTNAAKILKKSLGDKNLEVADCYVQIVDAVLKESSEGKANHNLLREALSYLNKAQEIYLEKLQSNHTKILQCDSLDFILQEFLPSH